MYEQEWVRIKKFLAYMILEMDARGIDVHSNSFDAGSYRTYRIIYEQMLRYEFDMVRHYYGDELFDSPVEGGRGEHYDTPPSDH